MRKSAQRSNSRSSGGPPKSARPDLLQRLLPAPWMRRRRRRLTVPAGRAGGRRRREPLGGEAESPGERHNGSGRARERESGRALGVPGGRERARAASATFYFALTCFFAFSFLLCFRLGFALPRPLPPNKPGSPPTTTPPRKAPRLPGSSSPAPRIRRAPLPPLTVIAPRVRLLSALTPGAIRHDPLACV